MISGKLILASILAAFGCVGDGCILTATSTALAFRWSALRAGLTIGLAHLFYECLGVFVGTLGDLRGERIGLIISLLGGIGLLFCITRHSKHMHQHHADGSMCEHHDHHQVSAPVASASILFITSADAFFAGVSIPASFDSLPRMAFFISAMITATIVGSITGGFLFLARKGELGLSAQARVRFREGTLMLAYIFVGWLLLASSFKLLFP